MPSRLHQANDLRRKPSCLDRRPMPSCSVNLKNPMDRDRYWVRPTQCILACPEMRQLYLTAVSSPTRTIRPSDSPQKKGQQVQGDEGCWRYDVPSLARGTVEFLPPLG